MSAYQEHYDQFPDEGHAPTVKPLVVEARFVCGSVTHTVNGNLELGTVNDKLKNHFKPGVKYRVLIEEIP